MSVNDFATRNMTSSQKAAEAAIARYEQTEDLIQAFAHLDKEQVRRIAQEQESNTGPLKGLVIGIKDLINTKDAPATYGSPIYRDNRPTQDAAIVQALMAAGAVPFGKTVTTEFALFSPPKTRNPWNLEHTPGGSSSGSAAAVAANVVPVALGTQTAGSVVRPATFCGIYGFKPSFGALPSSGLKTISPSLDTVGILGQGLDDVRRVFNALRSTPEVSQVLLQAPLRMSFLHTPWWDDIAEDLRDRLEAIVTHLKRDEGQFDVQLSDKDKLFGELTHAQQTIMGAEVLIHLGHERQHHLEQLSPALQTYLEKSAQIPTAELTQAQAVINQVKRQPELIFGEADLILSAAALGEAPTRDTTGDPVLCRAWTALGIPCINLPLGFGNHGLPLGLQVAARPGQDDLLLEAATRIAHRLGTLTIALPELRS
ncbi:amidase [Alcaligenes sp. SMD-FA]|uniref:amidase n=1 Tax=Alcaligenes sp. SMD-FA TaxID=2991054 RepID=UPI002227E24E|nr:amidase [Alcaligenes sp. SMD-FA]UYY88215.1 amidase [Alcaligenes sp. SMD-FA]